MSSPAEDLLALEDSWTKRGCGFDAREKVIGSPAANRPFYQAGTGHGHAPGQDAAFFRRLGDGGSECALW